MCGGHSAPNSRHISIFTDGISCLYMQLDSYTGYMGDYVWGALWVRVGRILRVWIGVCLGCWLGVGLVVGCVVSFITFW